MGLVSDSKTKVDHELDEDAFGGRGLDAFLRR